MPSNGKAVRATPRVEAVRLRTQVAALTETLRVRNRTIRRLRDGQRYTEDCLQAAEDHVEYLQTLNFDSLALIEFLRSTRPNYPTPELYQRDLAELLSDVRT